MQVKKYQEIQKDYFYILLFKKVYEELSNNNVVVRFSYLIITFLSYFYLDEESVLDKHDPSVKAKREEATNELKEKRFYKFSKKSL